jgi:undecaprenyl-diphosphatase
MPLASRSLKYLHKNGRETRILIAIAVAAGLLIVAGKLASEILEGDLMGLDRRLLLALRHTDNPAQPLGPLWLRVAARDITGLGSPAVLTLIVAATAGFLVLKRSTYAAAALVLAVVGGTAASSVAKNLIGRARPQFVAEVAQTQTYSFPSGHAFLSALVFITLGAFLAREQQDARVRLYIFGVALVTTFLVGLSRVYIGVHWPTDVVAGWCAGAAWALLSLAIAAFFEPSRAR